jgi:hypothetical protein
VARRSPFWVTGAAGWHNFLFKMFEAFFTRHLPAFLTAILPEAGEQ